MSHPRFEQARLKHIWANLHIERLKEEWAIFLETDFCTIVLEDDANGDPTFRAKSLDFLPANIPLLAGDAIHNLKCALDFTISEILGWQNKKITFPMGQEREALVSTFRTEGLEPCESCGRGGKGKGGNAPLELAAPGIGAFIVDDLRPYEASGSLLWKLNKLDVRDKHRLLSAMVSLQTVTAYGVQLGNGVSIGQMTGTVGAGGAGELVTVGHHSIKVERYGRPTADLLFNEDGVVVGEPVLPTLVKMSSAVGEAIDLIDNFLSVSGWSPPAK